MNSIIVAYSKNRVIGCNGKIPWNIPSERDRMKKICSGKKIIMGRRSFDEIGHALSYCTIVIVSRTMKNAPKGCILAHSFEEAVEICRKDGDCIFAGGTEIYTQALKKELVDTVYATEIGIEFSGDCRFPELPEYFVKSEEQPSNSLQSGDFAKNDSQNIPYCYVTYIKRK